jgi:hypothetical protein
VLGPLPLIYRWIVCVLALLACVGLGAWLAFKLPVSLITGGAAIGAALGVVVVMLVLHDGDGSARSR